MALDVTIDFDNIYPLNEVTEDKRVSIFHTKLAGGAFVPLQVQISTTEHNMLPNVYNLAFGPLKQNGRIDDTAELTHEDYSKVFSTILLTASNYLADNKEHILGIDGSTFARAYLYFQFIQRNFDFLDANFEMKAIKYYVRIVRLGKNQYDNPFDFKDIVAQPVPIEKGMRIDRDKLFNYYIFKLK